MSFELQPDETIRRGLGRIARQQIDHALEEMTDARNGSRDESVHEARKSFKRIRALLRLVRPVIDVDLYHQENACFRDAGRPLSEVRDAKIFIDALGKLADHFKDQVPGGPFVKVRRALQSNLRAVRKRVLDDQKAFTVVGETLRRARRRVKSWTDVPNKWCAVGEGLEDVHRAAGVAYKNAVADCTVEKLHDWRKQAKYLRHQLEVLRSIWPERMEELAEETHRMGELLGDDHDLAMLRHMLTTPGGPGDEETEVLLALIDRRRTEFQQEAMLLGRRFFQDRPHGFVGRLRGYWKAWRDAKREQPSRVPLSTS